MPPHCHQKFSAATRIIMYGCVCVFFIHHCVCVCVFVVSVWECVWVPPFSLWPKQQHEQSRTSWKENTPREKNNKDKSNEPVRKKTDRKERRKPKRKQEEGRASVRGKCKGIPHVAQKIKMLAGSWISNKRAQGCCSKRAEKQWGGESVLQMQIEMAGGWWGTVCTWVSRQAGGKRKLFLLVGVTFFISTLFFRFFFFHFFCYFFFCWI